MPRSSACLPIPKASSLVTNFAMKWLGLDGLDGIKPDQQIFTGFNDQLKKGSGDRSGNVHPQRPARKPAARRTADLGPDLSERSCRAPLRDDGRQRHPVPVGEADRQEPLGPAGQGRGADQDVLSGSHVAGSARRLGSRQDHRNAADSAAAGRGNGSHRNARARSRRRCARVWSSTAPTPRAVSAMA